MYSFHQCFKMFDPRVDQRVRLGVFLFVLQLASFPLMGQFGSTVQYFPQIVINQGSITSFTIHNPSATDTITVDVQLYSPNGDPLDSQQVELAAGGTETVSFGEPGGVITRGSAVLNSSGKLTATEFFQIFLTDLQPRVGVLPAVASKELKLPGFVNDEFKTGIALLNPSTTDSTVVTFRLKDKAGQAVLSETTVMLSALQSEAAFLSDDLFFGAGLSNFEGVVEISASPLPVALVSLIQEASGDVAAVPAVVLGLPLRGEFPEGGSPNLIGGHEANSVADGVEGATIGGGGIADQPNTVTADWGTVGGGILNTASGRDATVSGGFINIASGIGSNVGGGESNTASGDQSTVAGGILNTASEREATVAGGRENTASGEQSTVGGGFRNTASESYATVGGGGINTASGTRSTVGGGSTNTASGNRSTVGGGNTNTASGNRSTVGGGSTNTASGEYATVPGGRNNEAQGDFSFAGGRRAKALCRGCFVWADDSDFDFSSGTGLFAFDKRFLVRATGGVAFTTGIDGSGSSTAGVVLIPGSGSWGSLSDREAKEEFAPVDGRQVLEQLVSVPITTWNYKAQGNEIRHIGPTAQDFSAAFQVGEDERHITTVDADGVALAAIQGLDQLLKDKQEQIDRLAEQISRLAVQNQRLAERLAAVENRVD